MPESASAATDLDLISYLRAIPDARMRRGGRIPAWYLLLVNGQIKEARGLRRLLLRGIEKVNGEWHLITASHNLLKLFRFRRSQQQALAAASG